MDSPQKGPIAVIPTTAVPCSLYRTNPLKVTPSNGGSLATAFSGSNVVGVVLHATVTNHHIVLQNTIGSQFTSYRWPNMES